MPDEKTLPTPRKKKRAPRTFSRARAAELYEALAKDRPDPHTELNFTSPFALSQMLIGKFGGVVPNTLDELQQLPGVGRKTANVVLNEAFGVPTIAVDTHVFRVSNRTGLAPGKTPEEVERGLERITPAQFKHGAHHWLILHGRYVCKAQTPECWHCAIAHLCKYTPKTPDPATVSKLGPRKKAPPRKAGL